MKENKFEPIIQPLSSDKYSACAGPRVYCDDIFDRLRMPRAPHWAVAWSDLMMTMFILFLSMFVYQGVAQFELWTGKKAPVDVMRKAVLSSLAAL